MAWRRYSDIRGRRLTASEDISERVAMSPVGYRYLLHLAPKIDKRVIPRTEGRWSSAGRDVVGMVTTTGAKTGKQHSQPLLLVPGETGELLVIGSNYGRSWHPGWVYNLAANPPCTVTFRGETRDYVARELEGAEREAAWARAVDSYRGYAAYERRARPRRIKLFLLEPR